MIAKRLYLVIFIFTLAILGCSLTGGGSDDSPASPTQAAVPTADYRVELPFEGIWRSEEGEVYVLTPTRYYYKYVQNGDTMEVFGEILEYDLDQGHLFVQIRGIYRNNEPLGFDSPQRYQAYTINGDQLNLTQSTEGYDDVQQEFTLTRD